MNSAEGSMVVVSIARAERERSAAPLVSGRAAYVRLTRPVTRPHMRGRGAVPGAYGSGGLATFVIDRLQPPVRILGLTPT